MARVPFDTIFKKNPDGSLEPKQRVRVGGIEFGPGVVFNRGVSFGGVDFTLFTDRDFEVDIINGVMVITGIY